MAVPSKGRHSLPPVAVAAVRSQEGDDAGVKMALGGLAVPLSMLARPPLSWLQTSCCVILGNYFPALNLPALAHLQSIQSILGACPRMLRRNPTSDLRILECDCHQLLPICMTRVNHSRSSLSLFLKSQIRLGWSDIMPNGSRQVTGKLH